MPTAFRDVIPASIFYSFGMTVLYMTDIDLSLFRLGDGNLPV